MTEIPSNGFDVKRFGLTLLLVGALYWFCLQFVFPGFFAPTDPLHSDYYLPPALAGAEESIWQKMDYPRPMGFFALWLFGHLGLRGATALIIGLTLVNTALKGDRAALKLVLGFMKTQHTVEGFEPDASDHEALMALMEKTELGKEEPEEPSNG